MKLSSAQVRALRELKHRESGLPRIGLTSVTINGLVRKHLVERIPHPDDPTGATTKAILTDAGREVARCL